VSLEDRTDFEVAHEATAGGGGHDRVGQAGWRGTEWGDGGRSERGFSLSMRVDVAM